MNHLNSTGNKLPMKFHNWPLDISESKRPSELHALSVFVEGVALAVSVEKVSSMNTGRVTSMAAARE